MAIASITTWLNNPDRNYNHGRLLYEQYGSNVLILTILKSGCSTYHFAKLQAALEDLNTKPDLIPKPIVISEYIPEPAAAPGKKSLDFKTAPEQIIDIRNKKNQRFAQARKLHETIRIMDDEEHRLTAALELLDHMDYVNSCWESIDKFLDTGEIKPLPQQEQAIPVDQLGLKELIKEGNNLPSYICKEKKKVKLGKAPAKQLKATIKVEWFEKRLKEVKERLQNEFSQ